MAASRTLSDRLVDVDELADVTWRAVADDWADALDDGAGRPLDELELLQAIRAWEPWPGWGEGRPPP